MTTNLEKYWRGRFDEQCAFSSYVDRKTRAIFSFHPRGSKINGRPPAEADLERFFRVTPPTIHQMILKLEEMGLISRVPGQARTIKVLVPADENGSNISRPLNTIGYAHENRN